MESVCDSYCDKCIYMGKVNGGARCCEYIIIVGKPRGCQAGSGCTAKETVKHYRRRTSKMTEAERRAKAAARKREYRARLKERREQMKEEA